MSGRCMLLTYWAMPGSIERVRRALALYATKYGKTIGDVIEELVSEHLATYLSEADEGIASGIEGPKPRRGRKPRSD